MDQTRENSKKLSIGALLALGCALIMLVAFVGMPWINTGDRRRIVEHTGVSLLTEVPEEVNYELSILILIPISAVAGVLFASGRLLDTGRRFAIALLIMLTGGLGLAYYVVFVSQNSEDLAEVLSHVGVGWVIAGVAAIGLIVQAFVRARIPFARLKPNTLRRMLAHHNTQRNLTWLVMTLPAVTWLFIFKYVTLYYGLIIPFLDYKPRRGLTGSEFVGFENFQFLFTTDVAWRATRNTVLLNLLFIFVGLVFALFVAWLLFQVYNSFMTRYYQTLLLLPNFISWVIVSYFVFALLKTDNGMVNTLLRNLGMEGIDWYSSPQYWPAILLSANLWNRVGFSSLIYLSGMLGIDPHLYEAAQLDGASKLQQFARITFPLLLPLIIINILLALGGIFNADFGLFFQVTRDQAALYPTTDVLDTFIYRALVNQSNTSMAAAAQIYQSVVGFILVLIANWIVRRLSSPDNDMSLF